MTVQQTIEDKLTDGLTPRHLEVINESHKHSVPPGSESHFKVVVVSDAFEGQRLVQRHQAVNQILSAELRDSIHALSLQTHTAAEWQARNGEVFESPVCLGGGKADR